MNGILQLAQTENKIPVDSPVAVDPAVSLLQRRLDRERKTRAEAEAITEKVTRELYEKQRELLLLQTIAAASNEAQTVESAMQTALDRVCAHTGWPVGHVYLASAEGDELIPTTLWHLEKPEQFETFRRVTEKTRFPNGVGLPGRVLAAGRPIWVVDVTKDDNFPRAKQALDIGVRAGFGFPVLVGREVVAVLEFYSPIPLEPSEPLLLMMAHIGTQLGRVVERKRAEESLKRFAAKLESNNRELQDFAYVASHDLQEPLRKVQAFGERLKTRCTTLNDEGRDYLNRMQNAAARMQVLINDLLSLSRITTKAQPFCPVDLKQVVREVLSDLEVRIEQTEGRIEIGDLPTLDADPLQMRQLFQNLIGNALKFHRKDTKPVVTLSANNLGNGLCEIKVQDNGIGFEEKYAEKIFAVFQRLHGRNEYEGTGVGLAICRKIAERHGGTITAKGTPGQGATFRITLPVQQSRKGSTL